MANLTTDNLKQILESNNKVLLKQVKINTKNSIKTAIKENNKILVKQIDKVVNSRLSEFSDVILETIDTNSNEENQKFDVLSKDISDVKQDIKFIRHDISDIEAEMSNKPSRKQFEEFKSKFDNYPMV